MARDTDDRATIGRLADEVLPTLIERLTRSDLGELEVRESGWKIRLRRPLDNNAADAPRSVPTNSAPTSHGSAAQHSAPREPSRGVVSSPAVGYFTPVAGVQAGAKLRSGDLLGHVDVLGVRQEVAAPVAGVLRAIDVEPGQAVEYGQPIGRMDPEA